MYDINKSEMELIFQPAISKVPMGQACKVNKMAGSRLINIENILTWTYILYLLFNFAGPFVVSFEDTIYEVAETAGQVEICVILTSPSSDTIIPAVEKVGIDVFEDSFIKTNEHFPVGAAIASEHITSHHTSLCFICSGLIFIVNVHSYSVQ